MDPWLFLFAVVVLTIGFGLGRWSVDADLDDKANESLKSISSSLEAIPASPCPHCGKMRGEPVVPKERA